jgi:hypothetical protein
MLDTLAVKIGARIRFASAADAEELAIDLAEPRGGRPL